MRTETNIRSSHSLRRFVLFFSLSLFLVSPLAQRRGWCKDPEHGLALWSDDAGKNDQLSYLELVKLLNDNLKDAQQVNIYLGLCHSGALLKQANKLNMPYFVAVAEKDAGKCAYANSSPTDEKPPGRLTISAPFNKGLEKPYFYSFSDYLTKRLKQSASGEIIEKKIPTAQSLFDSASKAVMADPDLVKDKQMPGSTSGNEAKPDLAINGGAKSNHVLIFDGWHITETEPALELYRTLAKAKYGFIQNAGNSLQFYFDLNKKGKLGGTIVDGPGILANLKAALQNLKTQVAKNPKQELVNIFFDGDGYGEAAAAPRQPGLEGIPKDGYLVEGRNCGCLVVPTDLSFWHDLKVGIDANDEGLFRARSPEFVLYVSEASTNSPVGLAINNLPLGYFSMQSTSNGGELRISLPDSFVAELLAESDGDTSINVSLDVTPGDYLRIATEDDILLDPAYSQGDYGFGIATIVIGMGPGNN